MSSTSDKYHVTKAHLDDATFIAELWTSLDWVSIDRCYGRQLAEARQPPQDPTLEYVKSLIGALDNDFRIARTVEGGQPIGTALACNYGQAGFIGKVSLAVSLCAI